MPECENCGSHVTLDYVRVFSPDDDEETVRTCPMCPDMIRDGIGRPREARSNRRTTTGVETED